MANGAPQNNLLYVDEHLSCRHYLHEVNNGFIYYELDEGHEIDKEALDKNHLLLFVEGECTLRYDTYGPESFHTNEMVLIPRGATVKGKVEKPTRLLVLCFDVPLNNCDKLALAECSDATELYEYRFAPTPIRYPVTAFNDLMVFILKNAMNCEHIHEIKQKELFFLLRGYYSKQEVTALFYPLVAHSVDFKSSVLANFTLTSRAESLISRSNMSRSVFYKRFNAEFGMPVNKWISKQIASRVEFLAAEGNMSVKDIMYQTGFDSASGFNRFCKREFGMSPTELINQKNSKTKY